MHYAVFMLSFVSERSLRCLALELCAWIWKLTSHCANVGVAPASLEGFRCHWRATTKFITGSLDFCMRLDLMRLNCRGSV